MMKKIFTAALLTLAGQTMAQNTYYLPATALKIRMQIEKTQFAPGEFYQYSEKYLSKKDVSGVPSTSYKIIDMSITPVGVRDTAKCYTLKANKNAAFKMEFSEDGFLTAINADPITVEETKPFVPAEKAPALDPHQYMNQDILSAGSTVKMAQLTAQEIYDIRESKTLLNRGEAEFMPKDGQQLRIMLDNLNTQEAALTQAFLGAETRDTSEVEITFFPDKECKDELLFRFSRNFGFVDKDDLVGLPYYVTVEDKHATPNNNTPDEKKKIGPADIMVNVPGKVKMTITRGNKVIKDFDFYAGQFGYVDNLEGELFTNKKFITHLVLNPVTGSVEKIETEQVGK